MGERPGSAAGASTRTGELTEVTWLLERAETTSADLDFVWEYWTDVALWEDGEGGRP